MIRTVIALPIAGLALVCSTIGAAAMPPIKSGPDNAMPHCATPGRLMAYLQQRNPGLDRRYATIAHEYMLAGEGARIRWDVAFFQMIVETASLSYRRSNGQPATVRPQQNNFAGIGATGGNVAGESFRDITEGVRAHVQHLQMYAGDVVVSPVAERTRKVQAWRILDSWRGSLRHAVTFDDLALKWAPTDRTYGPSIDNVGRRFYDGFCHLPDPEQPVATQATAKPVVEARAPAAQSGHDLARQAMARASADAAAPRAGLGAGSLPHDHAPNRTSPQPPLTPSIAPPAALARPPQPAAVQPGAALSPAGAEEPASEALRALVAGNTIQIDTPLGTTVPITYAETGTMRGRAGALVGQHLGSTADSGRWWVENAQLCHQWKVWFDRQQQCLKLRLSGDVIHWTRSSDGKAGTARLARN